jgi:hypothetical protein
MIRMMNSDPVFLGPVNLGNPNEFTMLELAILSNLTGSKSKLFIWLYLKMILSKDNLIFL